MSSLQRPLTIRPATPSGGLHGAQGKVHTAASAAPFARWDAAARRLCGIPSRQRGCGCHLHSFGPRGPRAPPSPGQRHGGLDTENAHTKCPRQCTGKRVSMTSVGPAVQGKAGACTGGAGHSQRHKVPAIQRSPAASEATGQSVDAIRRRCHQIISTRRRAPHMQTFTPNCPAEDHRTQTPQRHAPQHKRSTSARTATPWLSCPAGSGSRSMRCAGLRLLGQMPQICPA